MHWFSGALLEWQDVVGSWGRAAFLPAPGLLIPLCPTQGHLCLAFVVARYKPLQMDRESRAGNEDVQRSLCTFKREPTFLMGWRPGHKAPCSCTLALRPGCLQVAATGQAPLVLLLLVFGGTLASLFCNRLQSVPYPGCKVNKFLTCSEPKVSWRAFWSGVVVNQNGFNSLPH